MRMDPLRRLVTILCPTSSGFFTFRPCGWVASKRICDNFQPPPGTLGRVHGQTTRKKRPRIPIQTAAQKHRGGCDSGSPTENFLCSSSFLFAFHVLGAGELRFKQRQNRNKNETSRNKELPTGITLCALCKLFRMCVKLTTTPLQNLNLGK